MPSYISTLFKRVTDENLIAFVNRFRIEMAKVIIEQTRYKINEVAFMVGYNNTAYFDRVFKSVTGMTPNEYYRLKSKENL
jgi:two-component system response regulator YesN